jgi:hypothetical protein
MGLMHRVVGCVRPGPAAHGPRPGAALAGHMAVVLANAAPGLPGRSVVWYGRVANWR